MSNIECEKCDRSPSCKYMIDATTTEDQVKGRVNYIKGNDCPKDWRDKKIDEMTADQWCEAFKGLKINTEVNHEKPPLGVMPAWLLYKTRIKDLAEAIARYSEFDSPNSIKQITKWGEELYSLIHLYDYLERSECL